MTLSVMVETNAIYVSQAGVARYVKGLLEGFREMDPAQAPRVTTLAWPVENMDYQQPRRAMRTAYRELIWPWLVAYGQIKNARPDLVHRTATSMKLVLPKGLPEVVTLHDLALVRHPERFRRWQTWRGTQQLHQLDKADHIICVSAFTAREATELLGIPPARMTVVHHANIMKPGQARPDDIPPQIPWRQPFFLFVGSLEPGKNLRLLQAAYAEAERAHRPLLPLVVVGARREGVEAEGPAPKNWYYTGYLSDGAVQALYEHATAFVFPSKYEGFGIPILEAMAQGCPVLCSPVASIPEVGGEAALYAELAPTAYREAMERLADDPALRAELSQKGRRRAAEFSWRRCAEETTAVYRRVVGG